MPSAASAPGETRQWTATSRSPRTDAALAAAWPDLSRARIQKLIRDNRIFIDGIPARASAPIREGAVVVAEIPPILAAAAEPEAIDIAVLYEDDEMLVVDKAPGMIVHPGAAQSSGTLVNALLHRCRDLSGIGGVERPGIVHRLDRDTSGCLVVAKTDAAHRALSAQFSGRTAIKLYLALACGRPGWSRHTAIFPIGRHPVHRKKMAVVETGRGRTARTDFHVLAVGPWLSLLLCRLHTGRTHQIRVHLQALRFPIVGDALYGGRTAALCQRVMLHAWRLQLSHPSNGLPMIFTAAPPQDFSVCFDGPFPSSAELDLAADRPLS